MFVIFNLFVDNSDRRFHSSVDNLDHIDLGSQPPIDQLTLSDRCLDHWSSVRTTFE